jgi:hypothetical protein
VGSRGWHPDGWDWPSKGWGCGSEESLGYEEVMTSSKVFSVTGQCIYRKEEVRILVRRSDREAALIFWKVERLKVKWRSCLLWRICDQAHEQLIYTQEAPSDHATVTANELEYRVLFPIEVIVSAPAFASRTLAVKAAVTSRVGN